MSKRLEERRGPAAPYMCIGDGTWSSSASTSDHGRRLGIRPGHFYHRDFVNLLFVAPPWRRQGLARLFMRAVWACFDIEGIATTTSGMLRRGNCCPVKAGLPAEFSAALTTAT